LWTGCAFRKVSAMIEGLSTTLARWAAAVPLLAVTDSGSIFAPAAPQAEAIRHLFVVSLWICALIFAAVTGLVAYSLLRYRWRDGEPDPLQTAGNRTVEIVWTTIPFLIVLLLFGLTVHAMQRSDPPPAPAPDLIVIGHQWWWEIRDPKNGFVTANEIHIPVGRPLSVVLDTADVLHEFWVPQLTRKMTTVPGARNHVWMQADRPGVYEGVCSVFCGTQHAWMRFQVIADAPADYERWLTNQRRPTANLSSAAGRGAEVFRSLTCVNCHATRDDDTATSAGPNLTHLMSRRRIGSGIVDNNAENLRRWLADPQQVKPGVKMPNFKLDREQSTALLAYLEALE
jgi:cytochrome c oxidase subunit 2